MRKFEEGKMYSCRSVCDHDCVWYFTVIRRTKKTVTIANKREMLKKKIHYSINGSEMIYPLGRHSMNPILEA